MLLPDPAAVTAAGLAALYHDRWQAETCIGELKTEQRGGPEVVLRSRTPEMVAQEFWAMLCVYQALRHLTKPGRATRARPEPDQLQTRHPRRPRLRDPGGSLPPRRLNTALRHLFTQLRKPANLTPRQTGRAAPRQRKRGGSHRYN